MAEPATILLVEDDVALLDGIGDLLEVSDLGYELQILKATGGRQCLEILENQIPDLIISDIMMPDVGGMELIQRIRATPDWVQIPLIFLTAKGSPDEILEGRASGAARYVTKPFDREELVQLVRSQLDRAIELQGDRQRRIDSVGRQIVQLLNHEIRTPLTYLSVYQQMLTEEFYQERADTVLEYLQGIAIGVYRLQELVDDLVTVMELRTRPAEEYFRANVKLIDDLDTIVDNACQRCQWRHQDYGQILTCQTLEELPEFYGVPEAIGEITVRLIDNGYKFTKLDEVKNPRVRLRVDTNDDYVCIEVSDNGIGFPEQVTDQLFELFYQHDRYRYEQQGTGAGLAIVKSFVDLHKGMIEVSSEVGKGSTFTVYLPRYLSPEEFESDKGADQQPVDEATVLIVEDEWFLLEGLRDLLEVLESGYELQIMTASDGEEALRMMDEEQPDLIISDIMMPRIDGYELLNRVRKNPEWLRIPFIFLTAKSERHEVIKGLRSGVEEYITKPYDTKELVRLVSTQLDRYFEKQGVIHQEFEQLKKNVLDRLLTEFRNPLRDLATYTDQLTISIREAQSDRELKRYLEGIQLGSHRVSQLAEDYIFMTELRTGEADENFPLMAKYLAVDELIEQIRYQFRNTGYGIHLEIRSPAVSDSTTFRIDPYKFSMGLHRLAKTLMEFGDYDATAIEVDTWTDQQALFVRVATNEVNLTSEKISDLNALLELPSAVVPQLSEYNTALPVAKGVVYLHEGHLSVEREEGGGLGFLIRLSAPDSPEH